MLIGLGEEVARMRLWGDIRSGRSTLGLGSGRLGSGFGRVASKWVSVSVSSFLTEGRLRPVPSSLPGLLVDRKPCSGSVRDSSFLLGVETGSGV